MDAICINQAHVEERNYQVSLMKDIFQTSKRTVVWLGEESQDSERGIQLIRELAALSTDWNIHNAWRSHISTKVPPLYDPAWNAFTNILQRPWFHRAWIVQETSVTRDVRIVCGSSWIAWEDFVRAVQYAVDLGVFIAHGGSTTFQALRLFETRSNFQQHRLPSLHNILLHHRSFLATDARDKVFGLLSLADQDDVKTTGVWPNYRLSMQELYKNITLSLLKRSDLSAFNASGVNENINGNATEMTLPSWISDWSVFDPSAPLNSIESLEHGDQSSYTNASALQFNAAGTSISSPAFNHPQNLLGLEGILIDQVETVGTLCRTRYLRRYSHMFQLFAQCHDILSQLKDWEQIAGARSLGRYLNGEKRRDAFWYTICAGRVPKGITSARKDPRFKYYKIIRSLRVFVKLTIRLFPRSESDTWSNRFFYSAYKAAWRAFGLTPAKIQRIGFPPESRLSNYRRIIRTKKGYIALAPRYAKKGDWIGVFKGGKMPLVVRQDGEQWVLIGESYVRGIMNGEAWDEGKCKLMWFK